MATTLTLTDDTTTVDLNDGSATRVPYGGFHAPPPQRRLSFGGASLFRHGSDLLARRYDNRVVSVALNLYGATSDALIAVQQNIESLLRKAEEYHTLGVGAQVKLKYQRDSATYPAYFYVLEGTLDTGRETHSPALTIHKRILNASLTLLCEPFAYGDSETLSNYINDPGFEYQSGAGVQFSDWTVENGDRAFDTTSPPEGTNWGKITLNAAAAQFECKQTGITVTTGDWVFTTKYKITGDQAYELFITDSDGTTTQALTADGTERTGTVTRNTAQTTIAAGIRTTGAVSDTNDIVLLDRAYLGSGTTAPRAWCGSRNVYGVWVDGGAAAYGALTQAESNFIDIEDVPGDYPALLQVRAVENEAHTEFWLGARHGSQRRNINLWHEGEGFTGVDSTVTDAAYSSGQYSTRIAPTTPATPNTVTKAITTPSVGIFRVLGKLASNGTQPTSLHGSIGYASGGVTSTPSVAGQFVSLNVDTNFNVNDIGGLVIPAAPTPTGMTAPSYTLSPAFYRVGGDGTTGARFDWFFLMPCDQGFVYVSKTSAADVVLVDSRSKLKAAYLLNTSDVVQSVPANQQGIAPEASPDGTRLYLMGDDAIWAIAEGWKVKLVYQPRYLQVA